MQGLNPHTGPCELWYTTRKGCLGFDLCGHIQGHRASPLMNTATFVSLPRQLSLARRLQLLHRQLLCRVRRTPLPWVSKVVPTAQMVTQPFHGTTSVKVPPMPWDLSEPATQLAHGQTTCPTVVPWHLLWKRSQQSTVRWRDIWECKAHMRGTDSGGTDNSGSLSHSCERCTK